MSTNFLTLKKRVMARIYAEYVRNVFVEHPDYVMLVLFVMASLLFVSIRDVISNVPKDNLANAFNFFVAALRKTNLVMQILIAGLFVRAVAYGFIFAYKTIGQRWPIARLVKIKY